MHIVLVGTKAQLVKMAPVLLELERQQQEHLFVLTGQHQETMKDLVEAFDIRPADDQWVDLGEADTKIKLLRWLRLAWRAGLQRNYLHEATSILVHGDTLSTLLGAALGRWRGIPVAHVEAGLRSFNYLNPFPEECIRVWVSRLSALHFCPGDWACSNLVKLESKAQHKVINTGLNTIIDSLRLTLASHDDDAAGDYAVASLHRYENLSSQKRFEFLMRQVLAINAQVPVQFILHPVTRLKLQESGWNESLRSAGVELRERMDYVNFMRLLANSRFLITDGGSNQEEAAYMGLPCLVMRKATERREGLGDSAVLSMYKEKVIQDFVAQHLRQRWQLRPLPEIYPSRQIVSELAAWQ